MTKPLNTAALPDGIVRQVQDEAVAAGDDKMVAICERVLTHSFLTSSDEGDEQYDRDLDAIHRAIDAAAAQA